MALRGTAQGPTHGGVDFFLLGCEPSQDVIHGMWTVFPIPLGEAASFDPDLAFHTARATALETTASGIHWTFAGHSFLDSCFALLAFAPLSVYA